MGEKAKTAGELFDSGLNCAQSVFGAFCEDYGFKRESVLKLAGGFGSGMRSAEICGAVSGAVMVVGLKHGDSKKICNLKTKEFTNRFKEANDEIVCRKLLKHDVSTPGGREEAVKKNLFKTRCHNLVLSAAEILEDLGY